VTGVNGRGSSVPAVRVRVMLVAEPMRTPSNRAHVISWRTSRVLSGAGFEERVQARASESSAGGHHRGGRCRCAGALL